MKSLTLHEFFMKLTIMCLEKMFYWLLIQILLLNLDLKLQKCGILTQMHINILSVMI